MTQRISFLEKVTYGAGNILPTIVNVSGGLVLYFYTDVVGIAASTAGLIFLLVRVADAVWDLGVGRTVDRTRTRWGQGRPYLLWFAPVSALALVASFTVPALSGPALVAYVAVTYMLVWFAYSLIQIPQQSMMPLMSADPDERLRLSNVNVFIMFFFVVIVGAGFPILKDVLGGGNEARGFQLAAIIIGAIGWLSTWLCFFNVRERITPLPPQHGVFWKDLGALWRNIGWRSGFVAQILISIVASVTVSAGVYYFNVVVRAPQLVGPFLGLQGIGLMAGVLISGRITKRFCEKKTFVIAMIATGVAFVALFALGLAPALPAVLAVSFVANFMLGISSPITFSLMSDTADQIELAEGRRVVGTLFATVNFAQKLAAGIVGGAVGATLAATHYVAGNAQQTPTVLHGVVLLMSLFPAIVSLATALVIGSFYPLGRARLLELRDALEKRRAVAA